ncbi:uncharacterized protein [Lepisosteus oculatus]|uniref:uncharacterized protein isoform X1 n=1 Tax=Lepisosteus oculatus TaxID=7918 RepID=UPI003713F95E
MQGFLEWLYSALITFLSVFVGHSASVGNCGTYSFCWMINSNTTYESLDSNLWLNGVELLSIGEKEKFMSLKLVSSGFHSLTFQNGRDLSTWRISTGACSAPSVVKSQNDPKEQPISSTIEVLKSFTADQVFACESKTLYLRQEKDLIFAVGYTERFPVRVESRSVSTLQLSWTVLSTPLEVPVYRVTLYEPEDDAAILVKEESVTAPYYTFRNLDSCRDYIACVNYPSNPSILCVKALTDPEKPRNFRVTDSNSSSLTVSWDCPLNQEYTLFTVSVLYLNSTGHLQIEESYSHKEDKLEFTLSNLPPCSKLQLALQTVCETEETRSSEKIFIDAYAKLEDVRQVAHTNSSYTLMWSVRNNSSISAFNVYNDEILQGSTSQNTYTLTGVLPCHQYNATVEAICGEKTVMSVKTIQAETGPGTVTDLQFQQQDSKVHWKTKSGPRVMFAYQLYDENRSVIQGGKVNSTTLDRFDLSPNTSYQLEVFEECLGEHGLSTFLAFITNAEARAFPSLDFTDEPVLEPPGSIVAATKPSPDADAPADLIGAVSGVPPDLERETEPPSVVAKTPETAEADDLAEAIGTVLVITALDPEADESPLQQITPTHRKFPPTPFDPESLVPMNKTEALTPPAQARTTSVPSKVTPILATVIPSQKVVTPAQDLESDVPSSLAIVVPWVLPTYLQTLSSKPRIELEQAVKNQLKDVLKKYHPIEVELVVFKSDEDKTKITFKVYNISNKEAKEQLSVTELSNYIQALNYPNITVKDGIIFWNDTDECASPVLNECSKNSYCINTLSFFTCVCHEGYYDVSGAFSPAVHSACDEAGMFTRCDVGHIKAGISKEFLRNRFSGEVSVVLNDGSCQAKENENYYSYSITSNRSYCGATVLVNETHIMFKNVLHVTAGKDKVITRRDLQVVWKCVYTREYLRHTHMGEDLLDWHQSLILIQYNTSRILELRMTLHDNDSFKSNNSIPMEFSSDTHLFFEVTLHSQDTFAFDFVLEVVSCWVTETSNPKGTPKVFFLNESCPVDETFRWYTANGLQQKSRFSVQMFTVTPKKPIYVHCLTKICTQQEKENCSMVCPARRTDKRRRELKNRLLTAVLSAGPIIVGDHATMSEAKRSDWHQLLNVMTIIGGTTGFLFLTLLGMNAIKCILKCSEKHQERIQ